MIKQILQYAKDVKNQVLQMPKAILLLEQVRDDHFIQRLDKIFLTHKNYEQVIEVFDADGVYKAMRDKQQKDYIIDLQMKLLECESICEINTPTTIKSGQKSEFSIKC